MAVPLDHLNISAVKKKYIMEQLNPVLEELVVETLKDMPDDPSKFIYEYLGRKRGWTSQTTGGEAALLSSLGNEEEEDEESEEDEDDDVDELPDNFKMTPATGARMRTSVSAEAYGAWNQKKAFTPPNYPKSNGQKQRLKVVLEKSFLFNALEGNNFDIVIGAMQEVEKPANDRVINQGDDGDFLFVVETGELDCVKADATGYERVVKTCQPGDCFGELSLLYNCPRAASVVTRTSATLWSLDRETFNNIVKEAAQQKREKHDAFLKTVRIFSTMDSYERSQLADALESEKYSEGQEIVRQGEAGDKFYILEEGTAKALKEKDGQTREVFQYAGGSVFGELALLRNEPRAATIVATSDCKVLVLGRRAFKRLLGPLQDIVARQASQYT
mmetsp:Transcript_73739/g.196538  ORF Transcript_73739/g.196538 Transcript_73739/m.196538 type:complete len:388 (+) Transcript_73739:67-1230(+)